VPLFRRQRLAALAATCAAVVGQLVAPRSVLAQQLVTVSGHVLAENQAPLAAATVSIPSLQVGAITREDGRYSFTVPAAIATGQTVSLTARALGFKAASVDIALGGGAVTHDFVLVSNPLHLGEIVVTGEGTTTEAQKLGSTRSNVAAPELEKSNEPNVVTALAAKAPGVQVNSNAGDPGASTSILIRGANTLGGGGGRPSEPLFVVDGVPVDNSSTTVAFLDPQTGGPQGGVASPNRAIDINPDDIENIEVLKGAAAGSIYGARAGQGVVLITTKHGRAGRTQYSLKSSYSFDNANRFPKLQRAFGQGDGGVPDPCAMHLSGLDCSATADSYGPAIAARTPTFDHANEVFRQGNASDNTLTASGGNDRTTFFLSGAYLSQGGTVIGPNDYLKRASARLTADHRVFNSLRIGGNVTVASTNQGAVQKGFNYSSITWTSWLTPPNFNNLPYLDPASGLHRSYRFPFPSQFSALSTRGYDDPFFSANTSISNTNTARTFGDVHAEWDAKSWLKVNYTLGLDRANDSRLQGQPQGNSQTFDPGGQVLTLDRTSSQIDHDLTATASYSAGSNVQGTFTLGQNLNSRNFYETGEIGDVLLAPGVYSLNNTASQRSPVTVETHQRTAGVFGQGTLDLLQQLYLKAGLRYDGASTYSSGNLWAFFPSASAAWEFTKPLGGHLGPISYGKLRAAYGEVGTQPDPYLTDFIYSATQHFIDAYGGLFLSPQGSGGLATPAIEVARDLRPERTRELEGGFDLGLFGDRSDLGFTLYQRTSKDVILAVPVAASSGYQLQFANGAEIRNQGGELTLNVRPITGRIFSWEVGLLGSVNHTNVMSLRGAAFVPYGVGPTGDGGFGLAYAQVGNSVGAFRDYDYVRCGRGITLFRAGAAYSVDAACTPAQRRSHALFINDGTLVNSAGDPGDGAGFPLLDAVQRLVGSPDPKWTGSVRNTVKLGRVTLSALVDIRRGGLVYNGTREVLNFFGTSLESAQRGHTVTFGRNYFSGPVAGPGAGTAVTLDQAWFQTYYGGISPHSIGFPFYEDGSFTKLREISVTYSAANRIISRLGLSTIDLRVSGRNLAVWTKYTGADPEVNTGGSETGARGIDFFSNPQTRSVVLTVILNR
jgi:TonB-linked SusC/RagA family outer membrane protein